MSNISLKNKGILFSLLSIPVAIIAWLVLWQMQIIASIVPLFSSWLAVWLYKKGSKSDDLKPVAVPLLVIILAGVVLAFLAGMMMDGWAAYVDLETNAAFGMDFINFFFANLSSSQLWSAYLTDIVISLVFAVIGVSGIVKDLFVSQQSAVKEITTEETKQ